MLVIDRVRAEVPSGIAAEEAELYIREEIDLWKAKGKELDKVVLSLEGEEVVIRAFERSPIKRIRRITGYLSAHDNFNDAKRAELAERVVHA